MPREFPGPGRPSQTVIDRLLLGGALVVIAASLVMVAVLVVTGANRLGGNDDPAQRDRLAIDTGPTPETTNPSGPTGTTANPTEATTGTEPAATAPPVAPDAASGSTNPVVCIDVGHGGVDLGNVRVSDDGTEILLMEKELVLDIALALRDRLEPRGIDVVLTRETDTEVNATFADVNGDGDVSEDIDGDGVINPDLGDRVDQLDELQARVNVCNAASADLLFSIHANSSGNPALGGVETYWAEDPNLRFVAESEEVATLAYENLTEAFAALGFEPGGRGAASDDTWEPIDDDPYTFDHYIVLSPDRPDRNYVGATMPAVIVECLFVSNDDDHAFLTSDPGAAQNAIVTAYEATITEFFDID